MRRTPSPVLMGVAMTVGGIYGIRLSSPEPWQAWGIQTMVFSIPPAILAFWGGAIVLSGLFHACYRRLAAVAASWRWTVSIASSSAGTLLATASLFSYSDWVHNTGFRFSFLATQPNHVFPFFISSPWLWGAATMFVIALAASLSCWRPNRGDPQA